MHSREIAGGDRSPANFLGLADALLEQGATSRAVAVLRRMAILTNEPFSNLGPAAALLARHGRAGESTEFLEAAVKASPWDAAARVSLAQYLLSSDRVRATAILKSVAADTASPWQARSDAEVTLGGAKPEPATADALANDPDNSVLRTAVFRAALDAGLAHVAVGAMEPVWERGGLKHLLERDPALVEENENDMLSYAYQASQFLADTDLGAPERSTLSRKLAAAFEKLERPQAAIVFYRISREIQPSAEARAATERIRADFARRAENDRRRPVIRDLLDQPMLVRPRVTPNQGGAR